jgi:hypothetical protein
MGDLARDMGSSYSTRSTVCKTAPRWGRVAHRFFYEIFCLIYTTNSGVLVKNLVIHYNKRESEPKSSTVVFFCKKKDPVMSHTAYAVLECKTLTDVQKHAVLITT